jgi:hypothetical protein
VEIKDKKNKKIKDNNCLTKIMFTTPITFAWRGNREDFTAILNASVWPSDAHLKYTSITYALTYIYILIIFIF